MIWSIILLRGTAPQKLMWQSSVNFVIKSFQDFTLYVNIETLNTECRSDQEQEMWIWKYQLSGRCWGSKVERRVAFLSTFLGGFRAWKGETQKIQLRSGNFQRNNRERETWSFLQQFELCSKSESGFWFHFEKYRRGSVHIFLHTRKQYLAGLIQTCVHSWRLGKIERVSQKKLTS